LPHPTESFDAVVLRSVFYFKYFSTMASGGRDGFSDFEKPL
jgi:hypothetical protein